MKILFIVIDGLGDRPIPELGNKTPLETAKTPNLDWLVEKGVCGLVKPFLFSWQKYPPSDTAHLALFGYDPKIYYLGRGPYEAVGIGMDLEEGDVALRGNFATLDKNLKVLDRRAGRIKETGPLVDALKGITVRGVKFMLKKGVGHRLAVVLRNESLSAEISDSDPKKEGLKIKYVLPMDKTPEARFTADVLNKFLFKAHQILKKYHSLANCILTRGAGQLKKTPGFKEKYGLKAGCIAGGGLYKGIGKILGMDLIKVRGATGLANTDLNGKITTAKNYLKTYDFIFLHIKATDTFSHDGDFQGKKEFIEKIDRNLPTQRWVGKNTAVVITGDHSTCCALKQHCSEPIPLLIFGKGSDKVKEFSEKACRAGGIGKIKQLELMSKILS